MAAVVVGITSCSRPVSHYDNVIENAERVAQTNVDSAMSILDEIDPYDLAVDSIRAKYHY